MSIVALSYRYTGDAEGRDRILPEHRDYLRRFAEQGVLLAAGPHAPGEPRGALLLFRADRASVRTLVDNDPFTSGRVIATAEIVAWNPVIGPLAAVLGSTALSPGRKVHD